MILDCKSCPARYNYPCISMKSSEESPADVFSGVSVDDDKDLKY